MLIRLDHFRFLIREALTTLSPDKGSVTSTKTMTLAHNTSKPFKGRPRVSDDPKRLIPHTFSLGRNVATVWGNWGERMLFQVQAGSKMLEIDRKQFFKWGPDVATPIERGSQIYAWANENGIDIIKLKLMPIQDLEYCVLDTNILTPVQKA